MKYETVRSKERQFVTLTTLNLAEFDNLLPCFEQELKRIYCKTSRGTVRLNKFKWRAELPSGKYRALPAFSGNRLYTRTSNGGGDAWVCFQFGIGNSKWLRFAATKDRQGSGQIREFLASYAAPVSGIIVFRSHSGVVKCQILRVPKSAIASPSSAEHAIVL